MPAPDDGRRSKTVKTFYAVVRFEAPPESRIDCQNVSSDLFDLIEREYGHVSDVTVVKDPARCAACEALVESEFPGDVRLGSPPTK
jgi:hypothetical protein